MTGTSMSSPAVAGAIALMYAEACPQLMNDYKQNPALLPLTIKNYLLNGVDTLPQLQNKYVTGGRMNIENALLNVQGYNCLGTGIHHDENLEISNVYPNPASGVLNIDFWNYENQKILLEVVSLLGEKIIARVFSSGEKIKLNVSSLNGGYYFLKLSDENGNSVVKKFIKG